MSAETDRIIDEIAAVRAQNNTHFMRMWKLAFRVAPKEASEIQRAIRDGDMQITELNSRLANL